MVYGRMNGKLQAKSILNFFNYGFSILIFSIILLYMVTAFISGTQLVFQLVPLLLSLYFLNEYRRNNTLYPRLGRKLNILIAFIFIILPFLSGFYLNLEFSRIFWLTSAEFPIMDLAIGLFILLLMMEFSRRVHPVLFYINIFFFIYATPFIGRLLPEPFFHLGLPYIRFITSNTLEGFGVFGSLSIIGIQTVSPILILIGMLIGFGILESMVKIIIGYVRSPRFIPQISVISSACVGTVTGSITANVATTGSYTIPLMKRIGIHPDYAGAVEVSSSLGGMIMPPIMGIAAFVMAATIGVPYWEVATRALIPAIIYYASVGLCVYIITSRFVKSIKTVNNVNRNPIEKVVFINFGGFIIALVMLVYFIGYLQYELPTASYYSMISFIIYIVILRIIYVIIKQGSFKIFLLEFGKSILNGICQGVNSVVDVTLLLATLGVMINMMTATGLIQDLSWTLIDLAEASPLLLVVAAYLFGIIIGLGIPPTATYISLSILFVPAMVKAGFNLWASHFFAFVLAVIAEYSPPASIAAAVASKISEGSFYRTMYNSIIISLPIFIFPFAFLAFPEILSISLSGLLYGFLIFTASIGLSIRFLTLRVNMSPLKSIILWICPVLGILIFMNPDITIKLVSALLVVLIVSFSLIKLKP